MKNFYPITANKFTKLTTLSLLFVPVFAFAQVSSPDTVFGGLGGMINSFNTSVVKSVGTLFLTTAVVVFFFGIVKFILSKSNGDTGGIKIGQSFMAWGLLALFVMFSVWGIIQFFNKALGIPVGGAINVPSLEFNIKNSQSGTPSNNNNSPLPTAPSAGSNNYGSCKSVGQTCQSGSIIGTCKQNNETGELYCS